jgi:ribosome maturation factor RimP
LFIRQKEDGVMRGTGNLEDVLFAMLEPAIAESGLELVETEYSKEHGGWVVRLVIDKPGGITLDDCTLVSHLASEILDRNDPIPHAYRLEVTSPGIDRPLKTRKDFIRFQGEWIEVHLYAALAGQKILVGILTSSSDSEICLRPEKGEEICVEREKIAKVNLHIRF